MLVRRKGSSMSAPSTPHPSLPPTPLRVLASPRIGVAGMAPGGAGSAYAGVGDVAGLGAASCLVAKLTASATIPVAAPAGSESDVMNAQIFHVARLLRYKVFLLQQVCRTYHQSFQIATSNSSKLVIFTVKHSHRHFFHPSIFRMFVHW